MPLTLLMSKLNTKMSINQNNTTSHPIAKSIPHTTEVHGHILEDDYRWLHEKENDAVIDYLNEENAYTEAVMADTKVLQKELFDEILGRIQETDLSVPVKEDDYYYYSRTEEGKSYQIYCRKKGNLEADEEILLDVNKLAGDLEYFSLGDFEVSDNHQLLAYSTDTDGSEKYNVFIKDLATGELLADSILQTGGDLVWANDNKTLFYARLDEAMRPFQIHRHVLGSETIEDALVFEEEDDSYFVSIAKTKSNDWLLIDLSSKITSETWLLSADEPTGVFTCFEERTLGIEYGIDHHSNHFYILTNENAQNFKLLRTPVNNWDKEVWETVIPYDPAVKLDDIETFEKYLVVGGRRHGLTSFDLFRIDDEKLEHLTFDEPLYAVWESSNPEFKTNKFRYNYSSLITPRSVYELDMDTGERVLLKQYEVLGDYDKSKYKMERVFALSEDGKQIPMSVVYRKDLVKDGNNPCLLYAYGSYGITVEPHFNSSRISLLDRGFVFAIAHIRGGGEMGRQWYESGKFLLKNNTFTDFIACAEHLKKEGYTQKDKLAIMGGSAGGLLMGAVMNLRPNLCNAVMAFVPFVDVMNTMLDENLPLTVIEYDEWGNPNEKEYFEYMLSYSPYDNTEAKDYPNVLVTGGLNDPRVQYWEPAKWVAKLRKTKTDDNTLLLKMHMGAGHGGKSGRYGQIEEVAFNYAFMIKMLEG